MKRDGHKENRKADAGAAASGSNASEPTAQAAFASYAAPLVSDAIAYANAVRDDPSPEALHKLRVSLRRLRSLWWAFAPLLEGQLRLARLLHDVRGREVREPAA